MRTLRAFLASSLLVAAAAGCRSGSKFNPEANSGPDAKRAGAQLLEFDRAVPDRVDFDQADRSDWRFFEVRSAGTVTVELKWENGLTDLNIDCFDGIGVLIAPSPANSGESIKTMQIPIPEAGTYYVRVQAPAAGSASNYTIEVHGAKGEAEPTPREPAKHRAASSAPKAPRPTRSKGSPENALQGRIVGAHAEGGGTVLYLDKGASAGVKEGQNGWILDGPSGFSILEGGTFTITSVVDDGRSVAKTGLKSINRNTRVAINTGK